MNNTDDWRNNCAIILMDSLLGWKTALFFIQVWEDVFFEDQI